MGFFSGKFIKIIKKKWCTFGALLMHFWKCIKSASKPYESASKVHHVFLKILMIFSKNVPWLQCKIFIFNALSSKFDLSFEDVLLKFPSNWFNICCIFIALSLHFWKCKPSAIVFVGAFIDCTLIALSKVQSKCNGFWEIFTLHESNKISLKNGTLSKTIEERHIKQNHWRGASSENKITLQEPHKISLKRFLFWRSFKLNEPNKINYSEEVFLWNSFKLQKSNKISLRFWSMACTGPSTWVWWFTSNSKTNSINIKLKLGKFKFNHCILSKD